MRLVIDYLAETEGLEYTFSGAVTVLDPNLISLEFAVKNSTTRTELNVRGLIDMPLQLKAQFDSRFNPESHPEMLQQIEKDLQLVSEKINRIL